VKEQQDIPSRIISVIDCVPVLCSVLLTTYHLDNQIKKYEMDGYVTCMGGGEMHVIFSWGDLTEREHLGEPGVDR
jgi:hypothetical protein